MSATESVVRVAVANPIPGGDVTITYTSSNVGGISPASGQVIPAASVTANIETTGYVDFLVGRPPFGGGSGAVTFTSTSPDRTPDVDLVVIPAQEQNNPGSLVVETNGSDVILNFAGPATCKSWTYAVSAIAMPSNGAADAGTVVPNPVDRITKSNVVPNLGDRYYVKARQWNGNGGTGLGGPYVTAEVERQNKATTKTMRFAHSLLNSLLQSDPVARTYFGTGWGVSAFIGAFVAGVILPVGVALTAFRYRARRDDSSSAISVTLRRIDDSGSYTDLVTGLAHTTSGFQTRSQSISDTVPSTVIYVVLVDMDTTGRVTSTDEVSFAWFEFDYTTPDLETTI